MAKKNFIEVAPTFEELYVVRQKCDDVIQAITGLSERRDVVQSASDLKGIADDLKRAVDALVLVITE